MRVILAVSILGVLATSPVFADCTAPDNNVVIPNGSTATRDEMLAAQKALKAYNDAVKDFGTCLQQEVDAKIAAGGNKDKLNAAYAKRNDTEVDKVQALADRWKVQLAAFKAKPAG
jgi:hypothetical protein